MTDRHLCMAIYQTHTHADGAFSRQQAEGLDMDLLSFVCRDYWRDMMGSRNAGEWFLYPGMPNDSLFKYEKTLMNNQAPVFIQGVLNEINPAQESLNQTTAINHAIHHNSAS